MSLDVFSRIRQVVDNQVAQATQELLLHTDEWTQVENWLEDEASREAYRKELAFWALHKLFGLEVAVRFSGAVSAELWAEAMRQVELAKQNGVLPFFETGLPEDHPHVLCAQASGFILNQYEYEGAVSVRSGDTVLDCGALFGESAIRFRMYGAGKVYSFEPNPNSFELVQKNAARYDPEKTWFVPVPLAVGNKEEMLPFNPCPTHPGGSGFTNSGTIQVPVVTLDNWCEENGVVPNFIKMDLEGAEGIALLGAERIFTEHKPRFAICLYHKLEDMWQLPRLLKAYCPEYRFWCKKGGIGSEFVLFGEVRD